VAISISPTVLLANIQSTSSRPHQSDVRYQYQYPHAIHRLTSHCALLICLALPLSLSLSVHARKVREDNDNTTCPLRPPPILPTNPIEIPNLLTQILLLRLRQNQAVKRSAVEVHLPEANPCLLPHLQIKKLSALTGLMLKAPICRNRPDSRMHSILRILASNGFPES
jgi:hypothetical protein